MYRSHNLWTCKGGADHSRIQVNSHTRRGTASDELLSFETGNRVGENLYLDYSFDKSCSSVWSEPLLIVSVIGL